VNSNTGSTGLQSFQRPPKRGPNPYFHEEGSRGWSKVHTKKRENFLGKEKKGVKRVREKIKKH